MDLAPLSTFETLPINSGQFRAETGGAIIKVEVEQIQGEYKISRSYSEPGIQANLKNYTAICLDQHLIYTDTMAMSLSSEGLLWLELDSGHEFISPNLWLLLNKN